MHHKSSAISTAEGLRLELEENGVFVIWTRFRSSSYDHLRPCPGFAVEGDRPQFNAPKHFAAIEQMRIGLQSAASIRGSGQP